MFNLTFLFIAVTVGFSTARQDGGIDFTRKEDLRGLGVGRIIGKDNSIVKDIVLQEIREYWIVYIKKGSVHDMMMENIARIEFNASKWGRVKVEFPDGKPQMLRIP